MKTKNILLALLSIFFLGACHSPQTGIYNIMDYGAAGDGKPTMPKLYKRPSTLVLRRVEVWCSFHPDTHFYAVLSNWHRISNCIWHPTHDC